MLKIKIVVNSNSAFVSSPLDSYTKNKLIENLTVKIHCSSKKYYLFNSTDNSFYPGVLPEVKRIINDIGYRTDVINNIPVFKQQHFYKKINEVNKILQEKRGFFLRPFQIEAARQAVLNPFSSIEIATGGGKTLVIAALCYIYNKKSLILVDSIDLMNQLAIEFQSIFNPRKIGRIGAGLYEPNFVTVGIIDSVLPNKNVPWIRKGEYLESVKYLVLDETHLAASAQYIKVIDKIDSVARHCFTGTWTRSNKNEQILLKAMTGDCVYKVSSKLLVEQKFLPKPKIIMVKGRHGNRDSGPNNKDRNVLAAIFARHHYKLGNKILILTTRIKHTEDMAQLLCQDTINSKHVRCCTGSMNREDRIAVLKNFNLGHIRILVATKIFEKGINIPSVDAAINIKGEETKIGCMQSLGRILRGGKPKEYLDFLDKSSKSLEKSAIKRRIFYRQEHSVETIGTGEFINRYG